MVDFNGNVNGKDIKTDFNLSGGIKKRSPLRSDFERSPRKDEVSFSGSSKKTAKPKKTLSQIVIEKMTNKLLSQFTVDTSDSATTRVGQAQKNQSSIAEEPKEEVIISTVSVPEEEPEVVISGEDHSEEEIPEEIQTVKTPEEIIAEQKAEIERLKSQLEQNTSKLQISQQQIREMTEALEQASTGVDGVKKREYIQQYSGIAQNATLSYSHTDAPSKLKEQIFFLKDKQFKIGEIGRLKRNTEIKEKLDTNDLKNQFHETGHLSHTFPAEKPIKCVKSKKAYIKEQNIPDLGKSKTTGMTVDYGRRINWSSNKIARDIMQNFYDGHGNTLDGVEMQIEKLENGKTKVKISGQGVFAHDHLQFLGSGSKEENPYNAGGFGEGSRILVANILASGSADKITYSSADWKLTFDAQTIKGSEKDINAIMQTLQEREEPIDGNYIEFETSDDKLVDAIIDSSNYFEHSQNADFQNLDYDSKDFGFKFLPGNEKGNLYMTQRFEFEGNDEWDNNVENLTVIFKRKPDAAKFKEITGVDMPKDRDRTSYSYDDIKNLTHYFAHDMSDEDIMSTIISTRPMWNDLYKNGKFNALKSFIDGMIEEAESRNLKLNTEDERLAFQDYRTNETVVKSLTECNYTILPKNYEKLGLLSATDAFKNLSAHKPLEPTEVEVKKLKLLEEGVAVVQDNIKSALTDHLKNVPNIKLNPDYTNDDQMQRLFMLANHKPLSENKVIKDIIEKYDLGYLRKENIQKVTPEEKELCVEEIQKDIETYLKKCGQTGEINSKELLTLSEKLIICANENKDLMDVGLKEYLYQLKDLNLITKEDIDKPRFIFDRHNEIAKDTLGEAIIENKFQAVGEYQGHWVDREYLDTADFQQILGTWLHEICHKCGGDGSSEFTYALTDLCRVLLRSNNSAENTAKLSALEEVYNRL